MNNFAAPTTAEPTAEPEETPTPSPALAATVAAANMPEPQPGGFSVFEYVISLVAVLILSVFGTMFIFRVGIFKKRESEET